MVEAVRGRPIPYHASVERRPGEYRCLLLRPSKAKQSLDGKQSTSPKCAEDAWRWQTSLQMDLKTKMMISNHRPCPKAKRKYFLLFIQSIRALLPDLKTELRYVL